MGNVYEYRNIDCCSSAKNWWLPNDDDDDDDSITHLFEIIFMPKRNKHFKIEIEKRER